MKSLTTFLIFILHSQALTYQQQPSCPPAQYIQFVQKQVLNPQPIIPDPYKNPTTQYIDRVNQNLRNKDRVCALQYQDPFKKTYVLKEFPTRQSAESQGWFVTHQGVCGKCSTTQDLYVYLTMDLTRPVRACGIKHFNSHQKLKKCISSLGFTDPCTEIWFWDTLYTKKHCGAICMWSLITRQDFVIDGHLNRCLQCDEDTSGPIFKYESGRSRRNSGIKSEIDRPSDQIYNLTHCYY